jgi:nucleotide-binding universal stress UspA family protein
MFSRLLVTLDGSSFSEWALSYAKAISRKTGAALELASVHEAVSGFAYEEWEAAAVEWTEEYLSRIKGRLETELDVPVGAWVGSGPVVDAIVSRARAVDADLMVAATHGRGAISRAWLGSVADGLLRHSERPLLLVRPEKGEQAPEDPSFERIVVPLDGSEFSESILDLAVGVARAFGAEIHLLRIVAYPVEIASPYLPHTVQMNQAVVEQARQSAEAELERVAEELSEDGLVVETRVVVDSQAGHAICAECQEMGADLVVMATHGRGGLSRTLLGSTADKVIRSAHIPVLVRRPADLD